MPMLAKIAQMFGIVLVAIANLFTGTTVVHNNAPPIPQAAIISQNITANSPAVTSTPISAILKPNLLPVAVFHIVKTQEASTPTRRPAPAPKITPEPVSFTPAPDVITAGTNVTAQSFLDATKVFAKEDRNGPYEISFGTTLANGATFVWDLSKATIGGSGNVPGFSVTYACNPIPTSPLPSALDQNPTFNIRTNYTCTVGLAAQSGADQAQYQKEFSFNTGPGQFIVTPPASMNTVLANSENDGGFVFDNQDSNSITVTGLTLNISYTALNTGEGPLVLRFLDPVSNVSLGEYHLESLPLDPSAQSGPAAQFTHAQTGIEIPLSFTIPASSQKILPIELLGARTMSITGVNPAVTITLQSITSNAPGDIKTVLGLAQISWSCAVPQGSYDPNATSGAIYAGDACR